MDITIVNDKENPLLKRREATAKVSHVGMATPNRKDLIKDIAKSLKSKEDLVIIEKIFTTKGTSICLAKVLVYKKPDEIPKLKKEKQDRRLAKIKGSKETPEEEPKKEEKSSEAPKEKPKEESNKETPKEEKPAENDSK